ncbi:hypothetical protein BDW66DRAFT_111800 [Aspergillus desertorum]
MRSTFHNRCFSFAHRGFQSMRYTDVAVFHLQRGRVLISLVEKAHLLIVRCYFIFICPSIRYTPLNDMHVLHSILDDCVFCLWFPLSSSNIFICYRRLFVLMLNVIICLGISVSAAMLAIMRNFFAIFPPAASVFNVRLVFNQSHS